MATQTPKYKLIKQGQEDYYNVDILNENMDIIDTALKDHDEVVGEVSSQLAQTAKAEKAGGTATAIILSGLTLADGSIKTFIVTANNNAAATAINGKPLYKPGTTIAPKLVSGKAVTVWYDATGNCFFIKASATGTVTADKVLAGQTFSTEIDTDLVGMMSPKFTNLIKNGGFESNSLMCWEVILNASITTAYKHSGAYAARVVANNSRAFCGIGRTGEFVPKANSKYYMSGWFYIVSYTSGTPSMICRSIAENVTVSAAINTTKIGQWQFVSFIFDTTGWTLSANVDYFAIHDMGITTSTFDIIADDIILINLTDTFATGKELDKATIDTVVQSTGWYDSKLSELTADTTAIAAQVLSGSTAYVNGSKITGTMPYIGTNGNPPASISAYVGSIDVRPSSGYWDGLHYVTMTDPDFAPDNFIATKNVFGLQGGIPVRGSEEYTGWRRGAKYTGGAVNGRVHLTIPNGAYLSTDIDGQMGVFGDDADFIQANILAGKAPFGLAGALVPGKRVLTGSVLSSGGSVPVQALNATTNYNLPTITVSGLTFKPSYIIILTDPYAGAYSQTVYYSSFGSYYDAVTVSLHHPVGLNSYNCYALKGNYSSLYVTSNGFCLPVCHGSVNSKWIIIE